MTDKDTTQHSISDFGGGQSSSRAQTNQEPEQSPPAGDEPVKLLDWLQNDETPSPASATDQLPLLVDQARSTGYDALTADQCIELILNDASPPVDHPQLVYLLDNRRVDTGLVLAHLSSIFPRDDFTLTESINFESLEELSYNTRMEAYRVVSRLPPSMDAYSLLRRVTELFDGKVEVGGEAYPVGGYFKGYATQSLDTAIEHPGSASHHLVTEILQDHPWRSLRLLAAKSSDHINTEVVEALTDELEGKSVLSDFHSGRITERLCRTYIEVDDPNSQRKLAELIQAALNADIYPNYWNEFIPPFVEEVRTGQGRGRDTGELLATVFSAIQSNNLAAVREVYPRKAIQKGLPEESKLWVPVLRVAASSWPELIVDSIDRLVSVARDCSSRSRTGICEAIASAGNACPGDILPAIGPLVRDLERVDTAREVRDVGKILQALEVYPPPPELFDLYGSTDSRIDSTTKDVVASLRRQFQQSNPELAPGDVSGIGEFSHDYSLVKRTGPVTWSPPQLGAAELSVINNTAEIALAASQSESAGDELTDTLQNILGSEEDFDDVDPSIQFLTPSHDSEWFELAILGTAIAQLIRPDIRVAVHTPATGGWGTKKDIRESLSQYGIVQSEDTAATVTPILDLIPTARVTDGIHVETSGTTIQENPPYLTLVRDIDSLTDAPADVVLYNWVSGIDAGDAAQIQTWRGTLINGTPQSYTPGSRQVNGQTSGETRGVADSVSLRHLTQIDDQDLPSLTESYSEHPVHIEVHGVFAEQYGADRRQHVGPPTDLAHPVLLQPDQETSNSNPMSPQESAAESLTEGPSSVHVYSVESDSEIGDLLGRLDEFSDKIGDSTAAGAVRRLRYTFSSLPVTVDLHDHWVQNQLDQGNRWVPRRLHGRRNEIEELHEEAVIDAEILDLALTTVDTLLDRLAERNPLGEKLLDVLDEAASREKSVGVLCTKKTYKEMLDIFLRERASDWVLGDDLLLLDEDTVRDVEPGQMDILVTFDALPPQTSIYYHHPAVPKTIVLGHDDNTLASRVHGVDQKRRPYLPPQTGTDLPQLDVTTHGSTVEEDTERTLTDSLYKTYLSVASQSREDDNAGGRGSAGTISRYRVGFEDASPVTLSDAHPVIIRSEEHLVSAGEYSLRSLARISAGDEIVLINDDVQADLWEDFLREDWEGEAEGDTDAAFLDAVQLWYDAVLRGLEKHSPTDDPSDGVSGFASEIEQDVSVNADAVRDWARGVLAADSPSDLVFRSGLRIGPRHAEGVEVIASEYGSERMAENWEQVFTRIKTIRATHRQRGSVFWEWLADRACSGDLFDKPGVSREVVVRCSKCDRG
ncbi:hypothetical protein [Halapricum hydrolyticum]|uniref:Uncharacterized protein n=1 Tax=Halapricum hydrolyticum TaxID=2979991 RepID=A0AAE3LF14_9EURY|nr:hypothetical protein [Halapricum hydrolyticum]MCU4717917.1 hypothetical protein [Halapricum hydrolyticum]MCU4727082.1 hypothetical protein [Halapricum hydrolyticum]